MFHNIFLFSVLFKLIFPLFVFTAGAFPENMEHVVFIIKKILETGMKYYDRIKIPILG